MKTALAFAVLFGTGAAQAATMTFSGVPASGSFDPTSSYTEAGITATMNGDVGSDAGPFPAESQHLDDFGSSYPSQVTFTTGGRFDAVSVDFLGWVFSYESLDFATAPFDNIRLSGFRGGTIVETRDIPVLGDIVDYDLTGFGNIDAFRISYTDAPFEIDNAMCDLPCSHGNIDNFRLTELAPVPLPAGLPLLMAGLGMLGLMRHRQRAVT